MPCEVESEEGSSSDEESEDDSDKESDDESEEETDSDESEEKPTKKSEKKKAKKKEETVQQPPPSKVTKQAEPVVDLMGDLLGMSVTPSQPSQPQPNTTSGGGGGGGMDLFDDMFGDSSSAPQQNAYNGPPMTQAFDSQKGQGMAMSVAFERNTMIIKVDNKSNGDISRIDIKFNKNYLGIQPQGSVPLNGNVGAGQSQTIKLPLQLSQEPTPKQPLDLTVQMAARVMNSSLPKPPVTMFMVQIPAEIFFDNQNGNTLTDRSAFLAEWRAIPNTEDQSQTIKPCKNTDTNVVKGIFMKNGCSFIADRQIPNRGVSLYFASTLRGMAVLLEVSLANNGACRMVVKSKNKYLSYIACQTGVKLVNS